jgi:hypothetical protein
MPALKNPRHEKFAQELAQGRTADEAYAAAGYTPNRGNATRMKANESIRSRLAELQAKSADAVNMTAADIARQLDEDREFARQNGSAAAAVSATMGKAKVLGLVVDRAELTGRGGGPIQTEKVSARDLLADKLAGIAARRGPDGDTGKPH